MDINYFQNDLQMSQLDKLFDIRNMDDMDELFTSCLLGIFDLHDPIETVRVNNPHAPWLTYPLKVIVKERDKALGRYLRNKSQENRIFYKHLRHFVLSCIRREKVA